ncbi:MAG: hypothetical protein AAF196_11115 [Planctomycetota bacterium]
MKGLDKFTPIRLAEALTQKGAVPSEIVSDSLYAQEHSGQSFVELLIDSGAVTEWDLAKIVVEQFQLPFFTVSNYQSPAEIKEVVPAEVLFETQVVPLDIFEDVLTVALPVYSSFETFGKIERAAKKKLYPYIGLVSENRKILAERYPNYLDWEKERKKKIEAQINQKPSGAQAPMDGWQNIFDVGDEQVRQGLG